MALTQDQLTAIQSRLTQGYFLKDDMDALGLTGPVSLDAVRAKVRAALAPVAPVVAVDTDAARAQAAFDEQQKEIQAAKERAAIIDAIAAKRAEELQAQADAKALADVKKRFEDAIKADPNTTNQAPK